MGGSSYISPTGKLRTFWAFSECFYHLLRIRSNIRNLELSRSSGYYLILFWCFSSFLSYNLFNKKKTQTKIIPTRKNLNFCFKVQPENWRLNFVIYNFGIQFEANLFLDKVFCKHLDLVIYQLLYKIFQPFKEQKWCPSLGALNFGVNSECFAQLLRIRSKTPNFGVTKNSDDNLLLMLQVCSLVDKSRSPFSWVYYCWFFMALNM